ncbi:lysyl-tRNA synthetase, class I [Bartonella schoenbuchensis R1]|uniref:Lysine--tRNA ligase n=1 Tax=Bartonella schoenbuchensis (strain DSM 13525 / NCTC 13165 / R1) TaxID=687861 RepID=A0A1S6XNA2_BARSR|nr:lysyl-tRNA synthetase, class I [Bartonella schoenbuchensis R1]
MRDQCAALSLTPELIDAAAQSKAWPFEEARKIIKRYEKTGYPESVLFETGYGPSGLPHIGTFGEVARTTMVRHAFHILTENQVKTKILCFSDDMDGLRKVPDNVPNREKMECYLGQPLSRVPDPFGDVYPSFGAANNARLCTFLDHFDFDYEFVSSTDYYNSGRFDEALLKILACYDQVMDIILPTLGEERRATYSLFLPISPVSGKVLQVPMIDRNVEEGTVTYIEPETGETIETEITRGKVKCQWKVDWAMRWKALGVDYEMAGKDLIDSVTLSSKICKVLDGNPPEGFNYELFLDDKGQKISKSKGNGLTIDEWLTYAPTESLALYMFLKPKTAKRLYFDVIPKAVDEYYAHLSAYNRQLWKERLNNPVWHIHNGCPPQISLPVSFAMLLNLVSASNAENKEVLWGFISRYAKGANPQTYPMLDQLVEFAIKYFGVFVKPNKKFRIPDEDERLTLAKIDEKLASLPETVDENTIQNALLDVARLTERYQDHNKKSPEGALVFRMFFFKCSMKFF